MLVLLVAVVLMVVVVGGGKGVRSTAANGRIARANNSTVDSMCHLQCGGVRKRQLWTIRL